MRGGRPLWLALVSLALTVSPGANGRVARPPEIVGPPEVPMIGRCAPRVSMPGGAAAGVAIAVPALRLGAFVRRAAVSFTTGGSGTSNNMERERRRRAGLPFEPKTFDIAGSIRPEVFAPGTVEGRSLYQQLPLKGAPPTISASGLVYAQATSPTTGRIASLQLHLRTRPSAAPRLRISGGGIPECGPRWTLDTYAPVMTAAAVRRLFDPSGCNWQHLAGCRRSERPRGRVLFVMSVQNAPMHQHRWVDYDLMAEE